MSQAKARDANAVGRARGWRGRARRRWVVAAGAAALVLPAGCCREGSGELASETRSIEQFSRVSLDVPGTLRLVQGPATPLRLRTDDNLMDDLVTTVRDDTLVIKPNDGWCLEPSQLVVEVSTEEVRGLTIDGSGDVVLPKPIEAGDMSISIDGSGSIEAALIVADDVSIEIDGSGEVDANLEAGQVTTSIDGSGDLVLAGAAADHRISIDGSGDVEASALATERTSIEIDGSGGCAVSATDSLAISIDGSGDVAYCGDPRVNQSIDGSGSVRRASRADCE
jgi:hypothetical protein